MAATSFLEFMQNSTNTYSVCKWKCQMQEMYFDDTSYKYLVSWRIRILIIMDKKPRFQTLYIFSIGT